MNKYKQINKIHRNVFYQGLYHREVHTGTCTYMLKSTIGLYSNKLNIQRSYTIKINGLGGL